jgi:hypothetical protein
MHSVVSGNGTFASFSYTGGTYFIFIPSRLLSVVDYRVFVLLSALLQLWMVLGCRESVVESWLSVVAVGSWLSGIGCWLLIVYSTVYRLSLSFSTVGSRENLMICRGPSFLSYDSAPRPPRPPAPLSHQQIVSLSRSSCVSPVQLNAGGGGGRVWSRITSIIRSILSGRYPDHGDTVYY